MGCGRFLRLMALLRRSFKARDGGEFFSEPGVLDGGTGSLDCVRLAPLFARDDRSSGASSWSFVACRQLRIGRFVATSSSGSRLVPLANWTSFSSMRFTLCPTFEEAQKMSPAVMGPRSL
jgi:hypothetical protein